MARMTFKAGDDYALRLSRLGAKTDEIAKKAIREGAAVVTEKIRKNLSALREDVEPTLKDKSYHYLKPGEKFSGIPEYQKKDLLSSLGITPVQLDKNGNYNAKIGFDGYGSQPTHKYPKGLPNQLAARATESGSSIRPKQPFVRPAVNSTKKEAVETMQRVIDEEIEKEMKR